MSSQQIYLDEFENLHKTMTVLANQSDVKPFPNDLSPDALAVLARDLLDKHMRMLSVLRDLSKAFGHVTETLREMQLAKEPEIESVARAIYIASKAHGPVKAEDAFAYAIEWKAKVDQFRAQSVGK